jgi:hypothetical protein
MSWPGVDAETAETVAPVVRLLRRAAELVWAAVDADRPGSSRQILGLGIDLAADEARNLLQDATPIDGPVPVGDEPAGLLRSTEQLLRRVTSPGAGTRLDGLRTQVSDLVLEANTGVGLTGAGSVSYSPPATSWPARRFSTQHAIMRRPW